MQYCHFVNQSRAVLSLCLQYLQPIFTLKSLSSLLFLTWCSLLFRGKERVYANAFRNSCFIFKLICITLRSPARGFGVPLHVIIFSEDYLSTLFHFVVGTQLCDFFNRHFCLLKRNWGTAYLVISRTTFGREFGGLRWNLQFFEERINESQGTEISNWQVLNP